MRDEMEDDLNPESPDGPVFEKRIHVGPGPDDYANLFRRGIVNGEIYNYIPRAIDRAIGVSLFSGIESIFIQHARDESWFYDVEGNVYPAPYGLDLKEMERISQCQRAYTYSVRNGLVKARVFLPLDDGRYHLNPNFTDWLYPKTDEPRIDERLQYFVYGLPIPPELDADRYIKIPIPRSLRTAVFERDAYRCVLCGSWMDLACDHIIPERHGGPTTLENLRCLCRPCNGAKGAKMPT